ncbi:MAG TPA: 2-C-methyl-D-erythritol 4-phosphate cytidylyltransferase [Vicinamibacterales bacterium]|nr:2-C-methyl-D-erythritol 4-phosphate cytidylyltransferase [Vicinamibacterales bacterium]
MHITAIVAAGGRGRRLGAGIPKQLLRLGGRPILQWSVEAFLGSPVIGHVVAVLPPDLVETPPEYLRHGRLALVGGGDRRQDSVALGLRAVPPGTDVVVIHDAARPLVDAALIERTAAAAAEAGAAIAALPARDTVKQCDAGDEPGEPGGRFIARTLPRETIYLAQTPQAFRLEVLRDAVRLGLEGVEATDEAALAERAGHRVRLVEGSARNIKITTREDLELAESLLAAGPRAAAGVRVGFGYDLHRLVDGRPLILGGLAIPFEKGLAGHSDADVVCHAVTDALLGAAAAGDIGLHFPDTDARWAGARSVDLLRAVVALVGERGFRPVNADVTVVAERPKLGPHRDGIVASLAAVLALPPDAVSLKAKTNEGVDATGRGEAMAAHAVVLLERI